MGGLLDEAGAGELVDIGLGLATISMLTGVIGGTVLVNWAVREPGIDAARDHTTTRSTASRLSDEPPNEGDATADIGLGSISRSFGAIAVAIFIGFLLLSGLRVIFAAAGSHLLDRFPLFPFTVIGGFLVQLALSWTNHEHPTGAAMGYGYKQLFYEPFLGGGILTALSVPIILRIASLPFGIASALITVGLIIWGVVRNPTAGSRHQT